MILCESGGILVSDASLIELHAFAASVGEVGFVSGGRPRYELASQKDVAKVCRAGACLVSAEQIVSRMRDSGLWKNSS